MGQTKKQQKPFVPFLTSDRAMVLISPKTVHNEPDGKEHECTSPNS